MLASRNVRPIPIDTEPIDRLAKRLTTVTARKLFNKRAARSSFIAMDRIGVRRVNKSFGLIRVIVRFGPSHAATGRSFISGGAYNHLSKRVMVVVSSIDAQKNAKKFGKDLAIPLLMREIREVLLHELTHASEPAHVMRGRALSREGSHHVLMTEGRTAYHQVPVEVHARTQVAVDQAKESARILAKDFPFLLDNRQAFFDAVVMRTKSLRLMHRFYTTKQYQKVLKTIYAMLAEEGYFQ